MQPFKQKILTLTTAAALAAGTLLAAAPQTGNGMRGHRLQRMTTTLELTADQQAKASALFQDSFASTKPIRQQLRQEKHAVDAAIRAGKSDQEVQQLAAAEGPQLAQLAAIRASTKARFYALLTPNQQQKLAAMRQARRHARAGANANS